MYPVKSNVSFFSAWLHIFHLLLLESTGTNDKEKAASILDERHQIIDNFITFRSLLWNIRLFHTKIVTFVSAIAASPSCNTYKNILSHEVHWTQNLQEISEIKEKQQTSPLHISAAPLVF